MENEKSLLTYDSLASSFIEDKGMALKIQQNINFVLNYKDMIKDAFKKEIERRIAYRELGSIVFSCIEALAKTLIDSFKKRCAKCKSNDKKGCGYKEFPKEKGNVNVSLQYLFDIRFFRLGPDEFDKLKQLNELRNYVHISKNISEKIDDGVFNLDYVNCLLDYYYVLIDQLDITGDYFFDKIKCLKILDDNGIEFTKHMNQKERQTFYFLKISSIVSAMLHNAKLNKEDRRILKMINHPTDVDFDEVLGHTKTLVLHYGIRFTKDSDYLAYKNSFKQRLLNFITKEVYIERIKNEI